MLLLPYVNCFKLLFYFFYISLHSIHHIDKAQTELSQLCKLIINIQIKKWNKYIALVFLTLTKYLAEVPLQPQVFFAWCDKLCSSTFGNYLLLSPHLFTSQALSGWMGQTLKLCQVGSGQMHIFRFLQKSFFGFKSRLWLGHSKTFTALCISHSCCVLRVTVLLEGKYSARLRFWMLWTGFSLRLSQYFGALSFSSILMSPSVLLLKNSPTAWDFYQHTLHLGWYSACDGQCLLSFKHDAWNWGSSDQRIWFLTVWGSFRCCFCKFQVSTLRRGLSLATLL